MVFSGNFDSGTIELMAVNIANGSDFPLFWYGQTYAGALEAYIAALFISLFGLAEANLCLSPILFSTLWIAATYWLFRELLGRRSGLIAAAAAVFSGYYVWYYGFALSGGYAIILAFGTLILALAVLLANRDLAPRWEGAILFSIGMLAGLGIWVHFFILPYLLVAALPVIGLLIRRRFALHLIIACIAALASCLAGLTPFFLANEHHVSGTGISSFRFTWDHIHSSLTNLLTSELARHLVWSLDIYPPPVQRLVVPLLLLILGILAILTLLLLVERGWRAKTLLLAVPLGYLVVFLCLFLPHRMAETNAPRYVLGFWSMFLSVLFAYGLKALPSRSGWMRPIPLFLVVPWLVHVTYTVASFSVHEHERQKKIVAEKKEILDAVGRLHLQSVQMVGNRLYGYAGQSLSALAGNSTKFVAAFDERFQSNAQFAEAAEEAALLVPARSARQLAEVLALCSVDFQEHRLQTSSLFTELQLPLRKRHLIAPSTYQTSLRNQNSGTDLALGDSNLATAAAWQSGMEAEIHIDLKTERAISGFWLQGIASGQEGQWQGLPTEIELQYAGEKGEFETMLTFSGTEPIIYGQGGKVYHSGYFGLTESRFAPVPARFLRFRLAGKRAVQLSEVFLFEDQGADKAWNAVAEVEQIAALLQHHDIGFTYADRWLSASLLAHAGPEKPGVFPRFNPRHAPASTRKTRILIQSPNSAVIVDRALADHTLDLLREVAGADAVAAVSETEHYTLIFFREPGKDRRWLPALYWNGHMLIRIDDPALLAQLNLRGSGLPVFNSSHLVSQGFFQDGWTNGNGRLLQLDCPVPADASHLLLVSRGQRANTPPEQLGLDVRINDLQTAYAGSDGLVLRFALPAGIDRIQSVDIRSNTFKPANGDPRSLGIDVAYLMLR